MSPAEAIRQEIERLDGEIARLDAEMARLIEARDALHRAMALLNGAEAPTSLRSANSARVNSIRLTITRRLKEAPAGLRIVELLNGVRQGTRWRDASIKTVLYAMSAQGLVRREGHLWKVAADE